MKVIGTILAVLPEASGVSKSGKQWRKKEAIVQYEGGQYPKSIVFQMMGDNIDKLNIQQGAEYELDLDFEARQWNNRYFLQASCWKATPTQQATQPAPAPQPTQQGWQAAYPPAQPQPQSAPKDDIGNDLPF